MDDEPGPFYNREGMILTGKHLPNGYIQNPLCGPLDFFNTTFQMGYWTKNSF